MSTHNPGCGRCAKAASLVCAGCHNIRYCEQRCQRSDWRNHKHLCSKFKDFQDRPSPLHRRAILLGESPDSKPEFVWVKVAIDYEANIGRGLIKEEDRLENFVEEFGVYSLDVKEEVQYPRTDDFYESSNEKRSTPVFEDVVVGKIGNGELLDHGVRMWYRDSFRSDGSAINFCLEKLNPGITKNEWRGPLLFIGTSKVLYSDHVVNLDTADLTIAAKGVVALQAREKLREARAKATGAFWLG